MMARLASYIAEQAMGSLKRFICAFRGHEEYLHFEKNRVYLECVACGHESPGWTVDSRRPGLDDASGASYGPLKRYKHRAAVGASGPRLLPHAGIRARVAGRLAHEPEVPPRR